MQLRCKHKDRLENKEVFTSAWKQLTDTERERVEPLEAWKLGMFQQKVVLTFICNKCGRLKTQTEKSANGPS